MPLVWLTVDGSVYARLMPGLVIASFGIGVAFVTAITAALALVAPEEAGLASGVVNTSHEVGGSMASAVLSPSSPRPASNTGWPTVSPAPSPSARSPPRRVR